MARSGLMGRPGRRRACQERRPGRCRPLGVTVVASKQPDGLQTRRLGHGPVGREAVCGIRLAGLMPPCDGQPTLVEARRRASAQGIQGRCSRTEERSRCQRWTPSQRLPFRQRQLTSNRPLSTRPCGPLRRGGCSRRPGRCPALGRSRCS